MSRIKIPPVLRPGVGGAREIETGGSTVGEALRELVTAHPSLEARVFENGEVPQFLNVFVDGDDIRVLAGLETKVAAESVVLLLPAVAGGSR
jgi:molybdopterin synthase sulfur carrier subunit